MAILTSIFINDKSQFFQLENVEENCRAYWWRNVLFIQNFFPLSEMCLSWSWYVAADFQLYMLGLFLLLISTRWEVFFVKLYLYCVSIFIVTCYFLIEIARNRKVALIIGCIISLISICYSTYFGIIKKFGLSWVL